MLTLMPGSEGSACASFVRTLVNWLTYWTGSIGPTARRRSLGHLLFLSFIQKVRGVPPVGADQARKSTMNAVLIDHGSPCTIAVIGLAGRFPGARNVDEFWANIRDGVESIRVFSDEELRQAGVAEEVLRSPNYVKARGVLDGVEEFDAEFFACSAREAEMIDPQQRLFLECAWQALEDAGCDPARYAGAVGVYAGCSMSTYLLNIYASGRMNDFSTDFQALLGNDKDYLSTRVSYKLNLNGPSIAVQTACSTSLVADPYLLAKVSDGR